MCRGFLRLPLHTRLCCFLTVMKKVDIGELTKVANTQKKVGANAEYKFAILKENGLETGYMFTDRELEEPRRRASINKEDAPKKRGFWQRVFKKR